MTATNAYRSLPNILERARRFRTTGRWPAWRWTDTPHGAPGAKGWLKDVRRVAENGIFVVLIREVETAWGPVTHAMISPPPGGAEPAWVEKQRIKDTLFGRERIAVEVMPRHSEIVDGAMAFHLWVLPPGMSLPFGLHLDGPPTPTSIATQVEG